MTDNRKSPIYTRTGDRGTTSLVDGTRVAKNSPRLEAYGTVDELNSFIGAINPVVPLDAPNHSHAVVDDEDAKLLIEIQSTLFDIGSYLATDPDANPELAARMLPADIDIRITTLERAIDRLYADVPTMKSFILPGGTPTACAAHVARTVARRAERRILDLDTADSPAAVAPEVIGYINRLSDYLFILARRANAIASVPDTPWHK